MVDGFGGQSALYRASASPIELQSVSPIHRGGNHIQASPLRHSTIASLTGNGPTNQANSATDPSIEQWDALPSFSHRRGQPLPAASAAMRTSSLSQGGDAHPYSGNGGHSHHSQPTSSEVFLRESKASIGRLLLPIGQRHVALYKSAPTGTTVRSSPPSRHLVERKAQGGTESPQTQPASIFIDENGVARKGDNAVAWLRSSRTAFFRKAYSSTYESSDATSTVAKMPTTGATASEYLTNLEDTRRQGSPERAHKLAERMVHDQFADFFSKAKIPLPAGVGVQVVAPQHIGDELSVSVLTEGGTAPERQGTKQLSPSDLILTAYARNYTPDVTSASRLGRVQPNHLDLKGGQAGGENPLFPLSKLPLSYHSPFVARPLRQRDSISTIAGASTPSQQSLTPYRSRSLQRGALDSTTSTPSNRHFLANNRRRSVMVLDEMSERTRQHRPSSDLAPDWGGGGPPLPVAEPGAGRSPHRLSPTSKSLVLKFPHGMTRALEKWERAATAIRPISEGREGRRQSPTSAVGTAKVVERPLVTGPTTVSRSALEECYEMICARVDAQLAQEKLENQAAGGDTAIAIGLMVHTKHPRLSTSQRRSDAVSLGGSHQVHSKRYLRELFRWAIGATIVKLRAKAEKRIKNAQQQLHALVRAKVEQEKVHWYRKRVEAAISFFKSIDDAGGGTSGSPMASPGRGTTPSSNNPAHPFVRHGGAPKTKCQRCEDFGLDRAAFKEIRDNYRFICGAKGGPSVDKGKAFVLSLKELQTLAATGGVDFDVNLFRRIDLDRGGYLELDEILHAKYPLIPLKMLRRQVCEWEAAEEEPRDAQSILDSAPVNEQGFVPIATANSTASLLSAEDLAIIRAMFKAADVFDRGYLTRQDAARAFLTRGQYTEVYGYSVDEAAGGGSAGLYTRDVEPINSRAKEAAAMMRASVQHTTPPPIFIPGSHAAANIALLKSRFERGRRATIVVDGEEGDRNANSEGAEEHHTSLHKNDVYWFDAFFPNGDNSLMYLPDFTEAMKFCFPPFKKVVFYENVPVSTPLPSPIPQAVLDMQSRMNPSSKLPSQ